MSTFRGRHFQDAMIIICVRWYLRYSLSYSDMEEIMDERGLSVDHVTIWRWMLRYAPILNQRTRREVRHLRRSTARNTAPTRAIGADLSEYLNHFVAKTVATVGSAACSVPLKRCCASLIPVSACG